MTTDRPPATYTPEGWVQRVYDTPEAICPKCGEPIRWCLDMFSFTTGFDNHPFTLTHARCAWTKEAFTEQRRLAPKEASDD